MTVLFIDLNDFKAVNDSFGHAVGDDLLAAVAARLAAGMRSGDTVARLGGDEFAVLLEEADERAAVQTAERLIAALAVPLALPGTTVTVRASVGSRSPRRRPATLGRCCAMRTSPCTRPRKPQGPPRRLRTWHAHPHPRRHRAGT